jgi:hypothetical protein
MEAPLGLACDAKIPPHSVTGAPLSCAEHAYELCDRLCSRQRDVVGGIQPRSSLLRVSSQEAFVEGQKFAVVEENEPSANDDCALVHVCP